MKVFFTRCLAVALAILCAGCNAWEFPARHFDPRPDMPTAPDADSGASTDADMGSPLDGGQDSLSRSLGENGDALVQPAARSLHAAFSRNDGQYFLRLLWFAAGAPRTTIVPVTIEPELALGTPPPPSGLSLPDSVRPIQLAVGKEALQGGNYRALMVVSGDNCQSQSASYRIWFALGSTGTNTHFVTNCSADASLEGLAVAGGYNAYDGTSATSRIFNYLQKQTDPLTRQIRYFDITAGASFNRLDWVSWPEDPRVVSMSGPRVAFTDASGEIVGWDVYEDIEADVVELVPRPLRSQTPYRFDIAHLADETYIMVRAEEDQPTLFVDRKRVETEFDDDPFPLTQFNDLPETPDTHVVATFEGIAFAAQFSSSFRLYHMDLPTPESSPTTPTEFESSGDEIHEMALDSFHVAGVTYVAVATIEGRDAGVIDVEIFEVR